MLFLGEPVTLQASFLTFLVSFFGTEDLLGLRLEGTVEKTTALMVSHSFSGMCFLVSSREK